MFLPAWPSQNERLHLQTTRHKGNYSGRTRTVTGRETIPLRNSHLRRIPPLMHSMASVLSLLLEMKRRKYSSWTCKTLSSLVVTLQCIWGWSKIPNATSTSQELKDRLAPWVPAWWTDTLRRYSSAQTPQGACSDPWNQWTGLIFSCSFQELLNVSKEPHSL